MSEEALLSVVLDTPEGERYVQFEAEREAFWNQYPKLLQQYGYPKLCKSEQSSEFGRERRP